MIIAHVDMDCFFCAAEMKRNPLLEGKPLVVGATGDRGVVCAANYEARKYGVFSATPISKARLLCPQATYLPPDGAYYRTESKAVMAVLRGFATEMEQVSIDEAYLDVTGFATRFDTLKEMGESIRDTIKERTRLSCSIGISHCRTISKIASDFNKPFGVTVVDDPTSFLSPLPIGKFPGVGKVSREYYEHGGVSTIGDLLKLNRFVVLERFGMFGVHIQQIAIGEKVTGLYRHERAKSIGRESTFSKDIADPEQIEGFLQRLTQKVCKDLGQRSFKTVAVKIRYGNFSTILRETSFSHHTASQKMLNEEVHALFRKTWDATAPIRLLGVRLTNLSYDRTRQSELLAYA